MARTTSSANGARKDLTVDDLSDQIETLKKDIGGLAEIIQGLGRQKGDELSDKAREAAQSMSEHAVASKVMAEQKARAAGSQIDAFVKDQPVTALTLATAVGYLIGMATSRR